MVLNEVDIQIFKLLSYLIGLVLFIYILLGTKKQKVSVNKSTIVKPKLGLSTRAKSLLTYRPTEVYNEAVHQFSNEEYKNALFGVDQATDFMLSTWASMFPENDQGGKDFSSCFEAIHKYSKISVDKKNELNLLQGKIINGRAHRNKVYHDLHNADKEITREYIMNCKKLLDLINSL